jgi:hypothetical protein
VTANAPRNFRAESARRKIGKVQDAEAGDLRRRIAAQRHGKVQKNVLRDTYAGIYAK